MDKTLERILSLLPRKPDGSFVRGAKKDFATSIGYDSGDIVSMWIGGTSSSYQKKLHEIAAVYHVSVEWLKGETDIKNPPGPEAEGLRKRTDYEKLNADNRKIVDDLIASLLKSQSGGQQ